MEHIVKPYCEAQIGGLECGQPVEGWGDQCHKHDPPNNRLHPEWPPPTIVEWVNGGGVSIERLLTELGDWLDYFCLSPEEWSARWYLQEQ